MSVACRSSVIEFLGVVLVPIGNFHNDVRGAVGNGLAAEARLWRDARGFVELVEFGVSGLVARFKPLMNDDVARRAGADAAAGVVQANLEAFGNVEDAARKTVVAIRDFLRVDFDGFAAGKKRDLVFLRGGFVFDFFDVRIAAAHDLFPQFGHRLAEFEERFLASLGMTNKSVLRLNLREFAAFEGRRNSRTHQQLRQMLRRVIQFVDALANQLVIVAGDSLFQRRDAFIDFPAISSGQFRRLRIRKRFRGRGQDGFGFRARLDDLALSEILLGILDGFFEHALDFRIVDAVARLNFNRVLLAVAEICRGNLQDAIGVDQKFYFNARQSGGSWRHSQHETRERAAIFGEFALALENVNVDAGLIVDACGVEFLRAGGNRGVARYDFREGTAVRFDSQRKRGHIEQQHILDAAIENVGLNG